MSSQDDVGLSSEKYEREEEEGGVEVVDQVQLPQVVLHQGQDALKEGGYSLLRIS